MSLFDGIDALLSAPSGVGGAAFDWDDLLPAGVAAEWPIVVPAFERPGLLGTRCRHSGRRTWRWQAVTVTFTAHQVVVTDDATGKVVLDATPASVSVSVWRGAVRVCGPGARLTLASDRSDSRLGWPTAKVSYGNSLLRHRFALGLVGQVPDSRQRSQPGS